MTFRCFTVFLANFSKQSQHSAIVTTVSWDITTLLHVCKKVVTHPKHFIHASKPRYYASKFGQWHQNEKLFCHRASRTGQNVERIFTMAVNPGNVSYIQISVLFYFFVETEYLLYYTRMSVLSSLMLCIAQSFLDSHFNSRSKFTWKSVTCIINRQFTIDLSYKVISTYQF